MTGSRRASAAGAWLARWRPILPLLGAGFILWLGFGALLPVLPLYFTEHGVDVATLGIVTAAWPAARLVAEPFFGWLADRRSRRAMMIAGLLAAAVLSAMPLVVTGPLAFFVLRALTGLATAAYDPAARGHVTDSTSPARRGEAFGLYSAAQMGGLIFGPALGALAAGAFGGIGAVFALCALTSLAGAVAIAVGMRDVPAHVPAPRLPRSGTAEWQTESPAVAARGEVPSGAGVEPPGEGPPRAVRPGVAPARLEPARVEPARAETSGVASPDMAPPRSEPAGAEPPGAQSGVPAVGPARADEPAPASLWNRLIVSAVVLHFGLYFAVGVNDVVWSLYLQSRGAGLDLIGLTFAVFGLPVLLVSPFVGRIVDRRGSFGALVVGSLASAGAAFLYPSIVDPLLVLPVILIEGAGTAFLDPALFSVVARGSPAGRSSTAQGIFGAAGTVGFIVSAIVAGWLAAFDLRSPFYVVTVTILVCLAVALAVAGPAIRGRRAPEPAAAPA